MKGIIKSMCFSLFMLPLVASAQEQTFVVRNNDMVLATISKKEITRIAFESDITFISSIAGELEYTTKDQDLYLRPNVEKPINFFVKTADEHTYKFLVNAKSAPATQIFIKTNNPRNLILHKKPSCKCLEKNITNKDQEKNEPNN